MNKSLKINNVYERHSLKELTQNKLHKDMIKRGYIGEDTDPKLYFFIGNLVDLIFDKKSKLNKIKFNGFTITRDLGIFEEGYGNASGGNWTDDYRKLEVKDINGKLYNIGFAVLARMKTTNHPKFGNSKGHTCLVISVEKGGRGHNSLQLNLDTNVNMSKDHFRITHNGKLTNGSKGSIKYDVVKNYVKENASHLMSANNEIYLGLLPTNKLFLSSDNESISFLTNLIEYAILRDEIRGI